MRLVVKEAMNRRLVPRVGREPFAFCSSTATSAVAGKCGGADLNEDYIGKIEELLATNEQP